MKKIIYLLFCFISFSAISQQPFAPIGAKWSYSPHCLSSPSPHCEYFTFESVADTVVDGITARKIVYSKHTTDGSAFVPEANLIMYGDGDRIYYYFENEFQMLYDFSAQVGDTFNIQLGAFANFYDVGSGNIIDSTTNIQVLVDSVGTTNINNEILRVLYLKSINFSEASWFFNYSNTPVIERIGSTTTGFFGESTTQILAGFPGSFRCYEDPDIFYKNPDFNFSCDYIYGTDAVENLKTNDFEISPNPTSNRFFIKNKNESPEKTNIQLIDFQGVTVFQKEKTINKNESFEVRTAHLASGIYFLKINHNNTFTIKKIIVNH